MAEKRNGVHMEKEKKQLSSRQIYMILGGGLAVCIVTIVILGICVGNLSSDVKQLESEKTEMQAQFDLEKKELSEKVTLLSNQLTAWIEEEEAQAQKQVPSGLPVSGKVITIESEPVIIATEVEGTGLEAGTNAHGGEEGFTEAIEGDEIDENIVERQIPTVVFGVKKGTQIVSAGAGVIQSVEDLEEGTCVKIDHGNGYVSVYLFKGTPKVKEGDEVLRGTLLFEVTGNDAKFSFQILENGEYVNPMDLMEIQG